MKKFIFDTWHGTFFILLLVTILLFVLSLFFLSTTFFALVSIAVFLVAPVISIIGWIISLLKLKLGRAVVQFFLFILWLITFFVLILARVVGNGAVEVLMDGSAMVLFSQNTFLV
jgi:hypothetical protein